MSATNPSPHHAFSLTTPSGEKQELGMAQQLSVGRGPHNDVALDCAEVSWSHVTIRSEGGALVVEDLGSRNGTLVDGQSIEQPTPLRAGSVISVGSYRFRYLGASHEPAQRARLHLQDRATGLRYTVRGGLFVIGPDEGSDLRLEGVPEHRIEDHEDGVKVDGRAVEPPYDIQIGDRVLRLMRSEREYTPTVSRSNEASLLLRVSLSPPEATVVDTDSGITSRVTARTRVDFLWVLATAVLEDTADGVAEELLGWRSDEDVSLAIWGREGLRGSAGRLNTLAYRLRQEFQSSGFARSLIEKRSGWSRLRHDQMVIERE